MNSKPKKIKRFVLIVALVVGALIGLGALGLLGLHLAAKKLKDQIIVALGPESEVGEIVLGWSAIEVRDVRVHATRKGPKAWPTEDTLRAKRIVVTPDLRSLISKKIRVHRIVVEEAYLSLYRARDGRLRLLPSLLEKVGSDAKSQGTAVSIGVVELKDGVIELFDATVRQPAHKIRVEQLQATFKDIQLPDLRSHTAIDLDGVIKGVQKNGKVAVKGWVEVASKDSAIVTKLRGVDLVAFQPYLIKAAETGVKKGSLDFYLNATVNKNRLHAPGSMTLSNLELSSTGGAWGTFMGMPRQAAVGALKDRNGKIDVKFTLDGNLNDPKFSLNEALAMRAGASVAGVLGVSVEGLVHGVGGAAQGIGNAVSKLFGK